ncbi:MASE3 domain-containing protein [Desulfuribacillus alkaliarsenatis]|uniref:histidine kinase n=1 Tax=Desulfuribacillus alkaliarsenatis TaxID=766136 RepID=A0A1E5G4F1_9FIRM|nr:MASE3 domain-containing protein [Desulfuribacillus alkaliarsenatis]OEF97539.1 hypothetical protein BHF68_04860 [Desulfuribacillus alkaliarsenatis]
MYASSKVTFNQELVIKYVILIAAAIIFSYFYTPFWASNTGLQHTILELIAIFVAFCAFIVAWTLFDLASNKYRFIGLGLLSVAIFDLYHTLYFPFLGLYPDSMYDLSTRFWTLGRFTEAIIIFIFTLGLSIRPTNRWFWLILFVGGALLISQIVIQFPNIMPVMKTTEGITTTKRVIEFIIISLYILSIRNILLIKSDNIKSDQYLLLALLLMIPTSFVIAFASNFSSYTIVLGHILKVLFFYCILRALVIETIIYPYQQLNLTTKLFRKVFTYSPAMKAIIQNNRLVNANNAWLENVGHSFDELASMSLNQLPIIKDLTDNPSDLSDLAKMTDLTEDSFLQISYTDGNNENRTALVACEKIYVDTSKQSLEDTAKSAVNRTQYLIVALDITEQLNYQAELAKLDRLHTVGQVAAALGHEVRNPMTTIRGFTQVFLTKPEFSNYKVQLELVISEIDRANSIITEFLALAKTDKPLLAKTCIVDEINKILPLINAQALQEDVQIKTQLSHVPPTYINRGEIRQVLLNIVKNAIDISPKGQEVLIATYTHENYIVIKISDQGPGIPEEIRDKIGEPFCTTKVDGTGIGLSISYNIIHRHGGQISFHSTDKGTTFYVLLPLNDSQDTYTFIDKASI